MMTFNLNFFLFKHKREGAKPWVLGRLALSKQTSRFQLPMDVKTLECKFFLKKKDTMKNLYKLVVSKLIEPRKKELSLLPCSVSPMHTSKRIGNQLST